jgi:hypothetical protein
MQMLLTVADVLLMHMHAAVLLLLLLLLQNW